MMLFIIFVVKKIEVTKELTEGCFHIHQNYFCVNLTNSFERL